MSDARVKAELKAMVYRNGPISMASSLLAILLCYHFLSSSLGSELFEWWFVCSLLLFVVRSCTMAWGHLKPTGELFEKFFLFTQLLGGLNWGILPLLWEPSLSMTSLFVIIMFPLAMAVGAISTMGSWKAAYLYFMLTALLPLLSLFLLVDEVLQAQLVLPCLVLILGQVVLVHKYHRNLHESKRLEFENEALVQHLTDRNRGLELARDAADQASRAKTEFLARMSHEICTPMNGVLGMTELLASSELNQTQRQQLCSLHQSGKNLLRLIDELLDVSRIESGSLQLEQVVCSPAEVLQQVLSNLAPLAQRKGIALETRIDAALPHSIMADPLRLQQVFQNLVGNAIKFTELGKVVVQLTLDQGGLMHFVVRDTGIGIEDSEIERVFDRFRQADGSISRRFGGSGLGLAIARDLIELMGGDIELSSRVGSGSTFSVHLPLEPVADGSAGEVFTAADAQTTALDDARFELHVLVAEDTEINRLVIGGMLEHLGCRITLAEGGQQAIEAIGDGAAEPYDLVLMDCQMPDIDGLTATRLLRQSGCGLPIIAVTANAMESDQAECRAAGMDDFLAKPFSLDELSALLERWQRHADAA